MPAALTARPIRKRDYLKSSSFQMAVLFSVLCGLVILTLGYFIYYFSRGHYVFGTEKIIDTDIHYLSQMQDTRSIQNALQDRDDRIFLLKDKDGQTLAGSIQQSPKANALLIEGVIIFDKWERDYAAKIYTFEDGRTLLLGIDITDKQKTFHFMTALGFASIIFAMLIVFASYLISHFVARRTNEMAQTAKNIIETGDLSQRIDVDNQWDDLSFVSATFNELLERIETLMSGMKQVTNNIAHDLRTPLTRLKNDLEDLQAGKKTETEDLVTEADHLLNTFNALLRISKIENVKGKSLFETVNLSHIIEDVAELYAPLAEDKNITLSVINNSIQYYCDPHLIFQALANLLDNAIKFTPEGGQIDFALYSDNGNGIIAVRDTGSGVQECDIKRIFERFYRTEESRTTPGSGLGLSLVKAVCELHNATISVQNRNPGLEFSIHLTTQKDTP